MAGVNKVILVGNLGADPEIRHLPSGSMVANFNIATSESYNNKNGERVTQTEWHRLELWDGLAKIAEQYLKKGSTIFVEGKIKTDNWQDNDGNSRSTTKIRVLNMQMLDKKGGSENYSSHNQSDNSYSDSPQQQSEPASGPAQGEDDLPF